jgi:calcineurin-like phosphoesterase family protein
MVSTNSLLWFRLTALVAVLWIPAQEQAQKKPNNAADPAARKISARIDPKASSTFTLVGAGDISGCDDLSGAKATAKLIAAIPGTVFAAGDLAYDLGTDAEFQHCYDPTWGRFKDRTRPAPGNHDYNGTEATGYFHYWGKQAGEPKKGYYSYDLGAWHVVVLNTNCYVRELSGCGKGSPEEEWLRQDLAAHQNACILAYGHHALFSSGWFAQHARHPELRPFWDDLYAAHTDLVLAGHEHSYERFAPQNPDGSADPEQGIREIVVGTGGRSHTPLGIPQPHSEVRNMDTFGVLKLTLSPRKFTWEFVPEAGKTFRDSGEGTCHNAVQAQR